MLQKLRELLRKRSKPQLMPSRKRESRVVKMQRLVAAKEMDNFWSYDGDEQPPIDPVALLENNQ